MVHQAQASSNQGQVKSKQKSIDIIQKAKQYFSKVPENN